MIDFQRNNLDKAVSPYLQQHKDNPVHWQEWSPETLAYAQKGNTIIFVSVGYATCHWCHVMAAEAFSDPAIAAFLNEHFVSIKVDKEQRPDIDQYMMAFLQQMQGQGGWPLNVFLTPELQPFFALTYAPTTPQYGMPSFLELLQQLKGFHDQQKGRIVPFTLDAPPEKNVEEETVVATILDRYQHFQGLQFPPHNTLLFLISYYEETKRDDVRTVIERVLEVIATRGLHDHLQGGFYRYCVDAQWTIPHFEKMLYDQAMLLWVYSAAYKVFRKATYQTIAEKIITCLEETFVGDGLYHAAHDADTDHTEGATYLWTEEELKMIFTSEEFVTFSEVYEVTPNFEGKIHLIKKKNVFLPELEKKLLSLRKKRAQPFTDTKYITSWNALLGIGLVMAYRCCNQEIFKAKAEVLFKSILTKHFTKERLVHSSSGGKQQAGEFLEDYAAVLLLATYLYEDDSQHLKLIKQLKDKVLSFKKGEWIESRTEDFPSLSAATFDHPIPSAVSLAEMAILRAKMIFGEEYDPGAYHLPLQQDFYNLMMFMRGGDWHIIHAPHGILWKLLPLNCLQVKDEKVQDCYNGTCQEFTDVGKLLDVLQKKWTGFT